MSPVVLSWILAGAVSVMVLLLVKDWLRTASSNRQLKEMLQALNEAQAARVQDQLRFSTALQLSGIANCYFDVKEGRLNWWNTLKGLEPPTTLKELKALTFLDIAKKRELVHAFLKLRKAAGHYSTSFATRGRAGEIRYLAIELASIVESSGRLLLVGSAIDVTRLRQLELSHQRSRSGELIVKISNGFAHHFNNLLTAISGHAELLEGCTSEEERNHRLTLIRSEIRRAASLSRKIMSLSAPVNSERTPLDVNHQLQLAARAEISSKGTPLRTLLDPQKPWVSAVPLQLYKAFEAVMKNANESMKGREGAVTVSSRVNQEVVEIVIEDEGIGMTEDLADCAFDPFLTTKNTPDSFGLGLPIAKAIIESHDGAIEIQSRVGSGTRVIITLAKAAPVTTYKELLAQV
jgi:signal transduction histidine kinase